MKWRIYFSHLIEYLDFCKNCSFVVRLLLLDNLWALFFYAFFLNFRTDSLLYVLFRVINTVPKGNTQEGNTMKELERKTTQKDGNIYEGIDYEIANGFYTVEAYRKNGEPTRLYIKPSWEKRDEFFLQEIYLEDQLPDFDSEDWKNRIIRREPKIQTTAYGAMSPETINKVIDGYRIAQAAVNEITENFGEYLTVRG